MRYVLMYESSDRVLELAPLYFADHQARNDAFRARGVLLETGPFADPQAGAMAIFTSEEAATEFATGDPFVTEGVVRSWRVVGWRNQESPEPGVVPMVAYADGIAALEWLARAFGFRERRRIVSATGHLAHGEMDTGSGLIMLASPTPSYQGPAHHRETCAAAREWSSVPYVIDGVLVHVQDAAAHAQRSRAAGALILTDVDDDGHGLRYRVEDLEGHRWMFRQRPVIR